MAVRGASRVPRVHLIDAHLYIFRAYYALPPLPAPDGSPTHAAYGFAQTLLGYLSGERPRCAAAAFDFSLTSFRNELEPGYKAGRTEPPADLEPQFELCVEVAEALGLRALSAEGYEADDVIATLAKRVARDGARVVVVSSDKDLAQVVTEDGRVVLHDLARGEILDRDGIRKRFGVAPAQIPGFLGLVGDAVDGLPGVPGVGPKSASALLRVFGSIEKIPADSAAWSAVPVRGRARLARLIEAHRTRALRTRELATLRRDVPGLPTSVSELAYRGVDRRRFRSLCKRLGWEGLASRVLGA